MKGSQLPTIDQLFQAILEARQRVYELAGPTPLHELECGETSGGTLFLKREDLSPIHAYKWRGAYNRMRLLSREEIERGVIGASAGNHAQGMAVAARKLGTRATIVMPRSTPKMKVDAVRSLGGAAVEVQLTGNSYDEAYDIACEESKIRGLTFIHAYDDLQVIAGQGTLADEVVMGGVGTLNRVYLQIGGGGMAAGVACWLRRYYPKIEIVGVEGVHQASMAAAVSAGAPVTLDYLDVFCDGTAVKRAGSITHHFCSQLIDRYITVTNEEVCAAIQMLWETHRVIPEPAGAMGLAGWKQEQSDAADLRCLVIVCGANMDFGQLSWVVKHAGIGSARRKYYRFFIPERPGSLLRLLEFFPAEVNIVEFQHGVVQGAMASPVIGIDATPQQMAALECSLKQEGIGFEDATGNQDVEFRIIHYDASLFVRPVFLRAEFHERPGALGDFLRRQCAEASIVYFNYGYTGERVGRALMGFDFADEPAREHFVRAVLHQETSLRHVSELPLTAMERLMGRGGIAVPGAPMQSIR